MRYIFDSSAIFRAIKENSMEVLVGNYTLELARFELGNIIWKESALHRRISREEAVKVMSVVKEVLDLMNILSVGCCERKILAIAEELGLTFYDASYVYSAREREVPLITEDEKLAGKARVCIKVLRLSDVSMPI